MANPFEKRAAEYLQDDEAFLRVVTPEPLATFFQKPAKEDKLYNRLTVVVGTPGSGKTTLARLFQFSTLRALLRNTTSNAHKSLIDTLASCSAISHGQPTLVGGRVPLESEYREFWEFPYTEDVKTRLMIMLLQARTVLVWLRSIQAAGILLNAVEIIPRADADAALTAIGGTDGLGLLARAREVELKIYRISAALLPPDIDKIDDVTAAAYQPFDVIEEFRIVDGGQTLTLRPLVIFDDAHSLHPKQFALLCRWLARRELKVARWILTRLDALTTTAVLSDGPLEPEVPGITRAREITDIRMQGSEIRRGERPAFRKMAKDMAGRYLTQMDVFNRRGLTNLADLIKDDAEASKFSKHQKLAQDVDKLQRQLGISQERRRTLQKEIDVYLAGSDKYDEDLQLAMLAILLLRYSKRVPQRSLFEGIEDDAEPNRPLTADASVADGARIHLLHNYGRPYYFGIDTLCDACSENAEQFLQLAACLVSQSETQLIRAKPAALTRGIQNKLLRERATKMVCEWDFPQHEAVRRLANGMAKACLEKSLEPNAPLGGGATAFGIPQDEFNSIPHNYEHLANVLKFGVAYNVFSLVPNYVTKRRLWCLVELGGVFLLHKGLTLKRGGFLERHPEDLNRYLEEA